MIIVRSNARASKNTTGGVSVAVIGRASKNTAGNVSVAMMGRGQKKWRFSSTIAMGFLMIGLSFNLYITFFIAKHQRASSNWKGTPSYYDSKVITSMMGKTSTTEVTLYCKQQQKLPNQRRLQKPKAIVHVGPHKTGSTTLQTNARFLQPMDHYLVPELPVFYNKHSVGEAKNTAHLASCMNPNRRSESHLLCTPDIENSVLAAFEIFLHEAHCQSKNILLLSEEFDRQKTDIARLKSLLEPRFDVEIVVNYRPYHTWIASLHNELFKTAAKQGIKDGITEPYPTIVEWVKFSETMSYWEKHHTASVYKRFKEHFSTVKVIDMNHLKTTGVSLEEAFYCNEIPNAPITCEKIRNVTATKSKKKRRQNQSESLTVYDLIGQIRQKKYFRKITPPIIEIIQNQTAKLLSLEQELPPQDRISLVPRSCLHTIHLDALLALSIQKETELNEELEKFRQRSNYGFHFDPPTVDELSEALTEDFFESAHELFCPVNSVLVLKRWETEKWFQMLLLQEENRKEQARLIAEKERERKEATQKMDWKSILKKAVAAQPFASTQEEVQQNGVPLKESYPKSGLPAHILPEIPIPKLGPPKAPQNPLPKAPQPKAPIPRLGQPKAQVPQPKKPPIPEFGQPKAQIPQPKNPLPEAPRPKAPIPRLGQPKAQVPQPKNPPIPEFGQPKAQIPQPKNKNPIPEAPQPKAPIPKLGQPKAE
ncbi:unnamed protein product [Pseudo-nitzschia multistriata]|uniref:Sulfotransferase domain-containing protein n=1 Tax=Pseudo-nitzschia multistriata TaxID=183589 RepID=A0A448ZF15_9STRA|nr:unnamed protein product [Pseudo-nitzschia multistriata]